MDHQDTLTSVKPAIKKSHIILLVIACMLLVATLLCVREFTDLVRLANDPLDDAQLPGAEFFVGIGLLLVGYYVFACFFFCWSGGQVISGFLVSVKEDKPRWLWVVSLILTVLNAACAIGMAVMVVMVGKWFFR